MESQAKYVLVGSVVLALMGLIIFAILWLSEARSYRNAQYYDIYFREHTLYGLQVNSDVTMRGIKVGSVLSLNISSQNVENVRVRISVGGGTPVKMDTEAQLNRNLLTGFASIDLRKGTQNSPLLTEIPPGESYPIIPEGKTELEQVADSLPEVFAKVGEITERAGKLLSDENIQSGTRILHNIDRVTASVADHSDDIAKLVERANSLSEKLEKATDSIRSLANKGTEKLDGISNELIAGVSELKGVMSQLNGKSGELVQSIIRSADVVAGQLRSISQNVQTVAETASSTLEGYEQPSRLLSGPNEKALGPGEVGNHGKK